MRVFLLIACASLLASCAATSAQPTDVLRCRQIEIVDAEGRVVVRIGAMDRDGNARLCILDDGNPVIVLGLSTIVGEDGQETGAKSAMLHLETGDGIATLGASPVAAGLVVQAFEKSSLTVTAGEKLVEERVGNQ